MRKKYDVILIGNSCIDLVAPIKKISKNKRVFESNIKLNPGGCAFNVAVASSRLGLKTSLISQIGKDNLGKIIINSLKKENVDTSHLIKKGKTAITLCLLRKKTRFFMHNFLFNEGFTIKDINENFLESSKCISINGYFFVNKLRDGKITKILTKLKRKNILITFDPGWDYKELWIKNCKKILKLTDILFVNIKEAKKLSGKNKIKDIAKKLKNCGPDIVVIKIGNKGVFQLDEQETFFHAYKVKSVDNTGAGDGFNAGFILGTLRNWNKEKVLKFSSAVGALTTTKIGVYLALPYLKEVKKFL